jgi:ABC-type dipeptide/oligopeptide/nickel transport system ATPase component
MSFNRNSNLKIVGFFGQSGSGKTTIIRNVDKKVNNQVIFQNTGIIRYLFKKNDYYVNPAGLVDECLEKVNALKNGEKNAEIDIIYERYIRSQFQLLNDWSTEVYMTTTESYSTPSILLVDRSPIDFYVLTLCGMEYLQEVFKKKMNQFCTYLISLIRQTAEDNTNNFLNAIFITKPWKTSDINNLKDGIRDQYLTDGYIGENWYPRFDDINLTETKSFVIDEDIIELDARAKFVNMKLEDI